jgi:hypothetical protein
MGRASGTRADSDLWIKTGRLVEVPEARRIDEAS